MNHLILAAGRGSRINKFTQDSPKCLLPFQSTTLLHNQLYLSKQILDSNIFVILGYKSEIVSRQISVPYIIYKDWDKSNMVGTLLHGLREINLSNDDLLITYGDCYYSAPFFDSLASLTFPYIHLPLLSDWLFQWSSRYSDPLSDLESLLLDKHGFLVSIGSRPLSFDEIHGQFSGSFIVPLSLLASFESALTKLFSRNPQIDVTSVLNYLLNSSRISSHMLPPSSCYEVDTEEDYNFLLKQLN